MELLDSLVDRGNTVIVIEHNLDVMKQADWLIDVGPDGGTGGGEIVFTGTPKEMAEQGNTITAEYLRKSLYGWSAETNKSTPPIYLTKTAPYLKPLLQIGRWLPLEIDEDLNRQEQKANAISHLLRRVHWYPNPSLIFQARRKLLFL